MDELALLRELEAEGHDLSDAARRRLRARVLREAGAGRGRRRRSAAARLAVPAIGIALLGVAASVIQGTTPGSRIDAEHGALPHVSARTVLHRVASRSRAVTANSPIPRDDQYVYTKTIIEERPIDGHGGTQTFADESWRSVDGSRPSRIGERGESWISPPLGRDESAWPPTRYSDLRALPTEPHALLTALRYRPGLDPPRHERPWSEVDYEDAYLDLVFLLGGWRVMPSGLQPAAFEALSLIPGVEIAQVDVDGRRAYGIRYPRNAFLSGRTLVVDSRTYDFLEERVTAEIDGRRVEQRIRVAASGVVDRIGLRPNGRRPRRPGGSGAVGRDA